MAKEIIKQSTEFTQAYLHSIMDYNLDTGIFTWKYREDVGDHWNNRYAGKKSNCILNTGYVQIVIKGRRYLAHRLAWLYINGECPPNDVDHINGITEDNRISNLRLATRSENMYNSGIRKNNKLGTKGVKIHCRKIRKRYHARIKVNKKEISLGYYETIEEASKAYELAAEKYHGEFARIK